MFHNMPPKMIIPELKMDLVAPEACFQAETAEESFQHVKAWSKSPAWTCRVSLCAAIEAICEEELQPRFLQLFTHLEIFNMFSIVTGRPAIHSHPSSNMVAPSEKHLALYLAIVLIPPS
jgi:hypothetical protein